MSTLTVSSSTLSSTQIQQTARGILAESTPLASCNSSSIPTAGTTTGTLVLALVGLPAATVVTNLIVAVTTVGSTGLTFAKMGLFSATGTFLGATAEFSTTLNATTNAFIVQPLTPAVTVSAAAGYYVGFLQFGNAATGATIVRGTAAAALAVEGMQIGTGARLHAQVLTQADITGNVTLANAGSSGGIGYWLACS